MIKLILHYEVTVYILIVTRTCIKSLVFNRYLVGDGVNAHLIEAIPISISRAKVVSSVRFRMPHPE